MDNSMDWLFPEFNACDTQHSDLVNEPLFSQQSHQTGPGLLQAGTYCWDVSSFTIQAAESSITPDLTYERDSGYGGSRDSNFEISRHRRPTRKRKSPARNQCSLCPKKDTRAGNLCSHLRSHIQSPRSPRSFVSDQSASSSSSSSQLTAQSSIASTRSSATVATSPPVTPSELWNANTFLDALKFNESWPFENPPSPSIRAHRATIQIPSAPSLMYCSPWTDSSWPLDGSSSQCELHGYDDATSSSCAGNNAMNTANTATSWASEKQHLVPEKSLRYKSVICVLLSDIGGFASVSITNEATNQSITSLIKESLGIPWNWTVSLEDDWGTAMTPHFERFHHGGTVYVRLGPEILPCPHWNCDSCDRSLLDSSSRAVSMCRTAPQTYPSLQPGTFILGAAGDTTAHSRSNSRSIGPDDSPGGSEGELSFVGSVDSDDLAEAWEAALPLDVQVLRAKLVKQLVDSYEEVYVEIVDAPNDTDGSISAGSQVTANSNSGSGGLSKSSNTSLGKRQRDTEDLGTDLNGSQETPDRLKKRSRGSLISVDGRLLACPYCKYDPTRYSERNVEEKQYRGCSSAYLTTVSRLKQHLYRVHKRPEHHCVSCYTVFATKVLLDAHTRERPPCELQEPQFTEKMTFEQYSSIKRRSSGQDPSETWYSIFETLFPGHPKPDSPYADGVSPQMFRSFMDHFQRQARGRLLELIRIELGGRLLMEDDQQRILDSALEASIAQLVSGTEMNASSDGASSPIDAPEEDKRPLPFQSANEVEELNFTIANAAEISFPTQHIYPADMRNLALASTTAPAQSSTWPALYPNSIASVYDSTYSSFNPMLLSFDNSLSDLPENGFLNHYL